MLAAMQKICRSTGEVHIRLKGARVQGFKGGMQRNDETRNSNDELRGKSEGRGKKMFFRGAGVWEWFVRAFEVIGYDPGDGAKWVQESGPKEVQKRSKRGPVGSGGRGCPRSDPKTHEGRPGGSQV